MRPTSDLVVEAVPGTSCQVACPLTGSQPFSLRSVPWLSISSSLFSPEAETDGSDAQDFGRKPQYDPNAGRRVAQEVGGYVQGTHGVVQSCARRAVAEYPNGPTVRK